MRIILLSFLFLSSCATIPSTPAAPTDWIPFELVNNSMRLELTLKDRSFKAFVDSGATVSIIDKALAKELIIRPVGYRSLQTLGETSLAGYASNISFDVNGSELNSSTIFINDLSPFDFKVLLGFNAIKSKIWEIDFPHKRLRFYDKKNYRYQGKADKIKVSNRNDAFFLEIEIDGKKRQVLFDTGAAAPLALAANDDEILALKNEGVQERGMIGGRTEKMNAWTKITTEVKIGSYQFNKIPTSYYQKAHKGFNSDGILGLPFVKDFIVIIDSENDALYFERAPQ